MGVATRDQSPAGDLTRNGSNRQSAYHLGHDQNSGDIDRDIYDAMRLYLAEDLGLPAEIVAARAFMELQRGTARGAVGTIERAGIAIDGAEVLDLGSGLGTMSEELVLHGARVTALEPGAAWASLTRRRVERHGKPFRLIEGFGEAIPLPACSVDLVVSLQVLEHVRDPEQVLSEVWRVLRPGGHFYLACENYLAFREGHYQLPWLPLMPKWLGTLYLRLLGRDPKFLRESVTYVTYPGILGMCRRLGFSRHRDEQMDAGLRTKSGKKWACLRLVAKIAGKQAPLWLDRTRLTFKFGVYELFRKP
jgi:SAM-dependent methyltransferase